MEGTGRTAPEPANGQDRAGPSERTRNVIPFRRDRPPAPAGPTEEPPLSTVIGEVLREERHTQGRTLAGVAEDAAVSLPYLSEVERGIKEVSSDVLAAICDALDLSLVELLERSARRVGGGVGHTSLQLLAA